jgi:FMN phosphatase YigB (HAD superfamily)
MDVFTSITVPKNKLDEIFDVVVSSDKYGLLKKDNNGKLYDIAMKKLGEKGYANSVLIDNSTNACEVFKRKGGNCHLFKTYEEFIPWAKVKLM